MAFTQYTGATNIIQQLDDQPNDVGGLSAAQLKAKFDQFGTEFVQWFNATHLAEGNTLLNNYDYSKSFHALYTDFYNTGIAMGKYNIYSDSMLHPPYSGVVVGIIDVMRGPGGDIYLELRPWNSLDIYILHYNSTFGWSGWKRLSPVSY